MASVQKLDTVLYEVQQALLQMSQPPPNGVYDSGDENALLMGSVVNVAGIMVGEAYDWQQLRKTFTATGDAVRTAWDLPPDFSRFVDNTGWSTSLRRPVVVINPQEWASINSWMSQSFAINPACRIMGDQLVFLSAPPLGDNITIEYIDANWVIDADDNTILKQKASKNADMPRFDWLLMVLALKMKWQEAKGLSTVAAQSDFNDRFLQLTQRDKIAQVLTLSGPVPGSFRYLDNWYNTPDTGMGM